MELANQHQHTALNIQHIVLKYFSKIKEKTGNECVTTLNIKHKQMLKRMLFFFLL